MVETIAMCTSLVDAVASQIGRTRATGRDRADGVVGGGVDPICESIPQAGPTQHVAHRPLHVGEMEHDPSLVELGQEAATTAEEEFASRNVTSCERIAPIDDIDNGMVEGCNHPMGPLHLADLIGLDTTQAVAESLYEEFKEPLYAPPPMLSRMVEAGLLGRKTGRGFYDYA